MNTEQSYENVATGASAPQSQSASLLVLAETLQNIHLLSQNPDFTARYGYLLQGSIDRLADTVSQSIGELDSTILEALASHQVQKGGNHAA